jgi:hypothetical protein
MSGFVNQDENCAKIISTFYSLMYFFMTTLQPQKVGLALGSMVGLLHLVWSLIVAIGLAQPLVDFILKVHMVEAKHTILPFSFWSALTLVVVTFLIGYVVGYVFAVVWNRVNEK